MAQHSDHNANNSQGKAANHSELTDETVPTAASSGLLNTHLKQAHVRLVLAQSSAPAHNADIAKAHTEVGNVLYNMGHHEDAAYHFEKSAKFYSSSQPPQQLPQADALLRAGCAYLRQPDWERSEAALEAAYNLLPAHKATPTLAAQIQLSLAIPLLVTGRKIRGDRIAHAGKESLLACSPDERAQLIEYCQTVARAYYYINDPLNLLTFQACAMQCALDAPQIGAARITEIARDYCETLRRRHDYVKVEEVISKAITAIEESSLAERSIATQLRCELAVNYATLGDHRLADQLLHETRDLLEDRPQQESDLPSVLFHLCELSITRGYYRKAEVAAMEAITRTSGQCTPERAKCLVLSASLQAFREDWRNNPDILREIDDKLMDAQHLWGVIASESLKQNGESLEVLGIISSQLQYLMKIADILVTTKRFHLAREMSLCVESVLESLPPFPKRCEVQALMYTTKGQLASAQRHEETALTAYETALTLFTEQLSLDTSPEVLNLQALIARSQLSLRQKTGASFSLTTIDAALRSVEDNLMLCPEANDSIRLLVYKTRRAIRSVAGDMRGVEQYDQKLRLLDGEMRNKNRLIE